MQPWFNKMMYDREAVYSLKERYRPGMRIRLLHMDDAQAPPKGTEGTVVDVDDIGSVLMKWDNGSSLNLLPGKDQFEIL